MTTALEPVRSEAASLPAGKDSELWTEIIFEHVDKSIHYHSVLWTLIYRLPLRIDVRFGCIGNSPDILRPLSYGNRIGTLRNHTVAIDLDVLPSNDGKNLGT